jgi:hypothetical protein
MACHLKYFQNDLNDFCHRVDSRLLEPEPPAVYCACASNMPHLHSLENCVEICGNSICAILRAPRYDTPLINTLSPNGK